MFQPPRSRSFLARVRAVRGREWRDLGRAQLALVRAWLVVRTRARGRLVSPIPADAEPQRRVPAATRERAIALAWAVDRVAEVGVLRATCLVRAMALQQLMQRDGIDAGRLQVGVARDNGAFEAHAWVELGGMPLGSAGRERGRFVPIAPFAGRGR